MAKTLLSFTVYACQVDRRRLGGLLLRSLALAMVGCFGFSSIGSAALTPRAPLGLVWESPLAVGSLYFSEVEALIEAYESEVGQAIKPGPRAQVGLKINTRGRGGLNTPTQLIRALVEVLEDRGYDRGSIMIVDHSSRDLRAAGILPPLSEARAEFEGSPVIALDSGGFYDPDWFYDSPLPATLQQSTELFSETRRSTELLEGSQERKSFLPRPLLFEVDFWINLAVGVDDPALGVDGVLANATLWNVSNSHRFLVNQATASAAVAEIAAIPELEERLVLNFVSLERYQFIGGPFFNSLYSRSEPRIWMSSDPVALDRLLYDRMNVMRVLEGFSEIEPLPRQMPFAASLGIGVFDRERIRVRQIPLPAEGARVRATPPGPQDTTGDALKEPQLQRVKSW